MMKRVFLWGASLCAALVLIIGATFAYIQYTLPSVEVLADRRIPESTRIYDRTGEVLLYEIHGDEKRTVIPFEDIPEHLKQATIAIEDENFYNHSAFSFKGFIRGVIVKPLLGERAQGGSTITQQLAKNAFLTHERTIIRKLKELALSFKLEKRYTKDEILSLYLNQIPYGATAYGIESASQLFFEKSARDLTLAESAVLASIPQAPTFFSPWGSHFEDLMDRKNLVLRRMRDLGFITEEERVDASEEKLVFASPSQGIRAPHFVLAVQDYLEQQYGESAVRTGGFVVTTTLDWKLQEFAEQAVSEGAERNEELYEGKNAALVAEDPLTGHILALAGSRDYFNDDIEGKFNVATQGLRQPGSALKPFVYAAAFKKGYTPDTVLFDVQTEFDATGDPERSYKPENYDGLFRGPVTIKNALAQSLNIPAVKALYLVGLDTALALAKDFGISTLTERSRYGLSLVLGGGEVRLIDLVHAYAVFADDGITHNQSLILEIRDKRGVVESYRNKERRVIDAQYARLINDILSDVDARRPLFSASISLTLVPDYEVALKTGTTNDYRDAWAVGYSPRLVAGVWAGNNDNTPMQQKGGSILAAVPIWHSFMSKALPAFASVPFGKPEPVPASKPILKGEHVTTYQSQGKLYPQFHDTLFYIDKNNPQGPIPQRPEKDAQFTNWETAALAWGKSNLSNFMSLNEPLPPDSVLVEEETVSLAAPLSVSFVTPQNGSFTGNTIAVEANVSSSSIIERIELYWNGALVDIKNNIGSVSAYYVFVFSPGYTDPQNLLRIVVFDKEGRSAESSVILFTKT